MSNCYTTFYFELPLPNAEVAKEVNDLFTAGDEFHADGVSDAMAQKLCEVFEDFEEYEEMGFEWRVNRPANSSDESGPWTLEVYSDDAGNTTHAGNVIEWLLPRLGIDSAGFEYACYGDGENSGGAQFFRLINGVAVGQYENSHSWLHRKAKPLWEDNDIQFARLLDEIRATQGLDMKALCESMDLSPDRVEELFERAMKIWDDWKEQSA